VESVKRLREMPSIEEVPPAEYRLRQA
jgi:hypothetical protein